MESLSHIRCQIVNNTQLCHMRKFISDLLRKSAEHTLMDMVQLLFTRLPQFKEDGKWDNNMKKVNDSSILITTQLEM